MKENAGGPDSGAAHESRRGAGREADSGPRVSLVPAATDGAIDSLASTAETRKVEIGRTTLMGVPSPVAEREKPTSPGHDVHLPGDTERTVDTQRNEQSRPVAPTGVIPAVEMDGSATRRLDNVGPGRGQGSPRPKTKPAPVERTIAGAAATFRAGQLGGGRADLPLEGRRNREPDRPLPADPDDERRPNRFVTALVVGVSLSVGFGIMVQGFIRARVRGAHTYEAMEAARPLPQLPPPAAPGRLDTVPAPVKLDPALDEPAPTPDPQPSAVAEPAPSDLPQPEAEPVVKSDEKVDRRVVPRARATASAGRPAAAPRPSTTAQRPSTPAAVVSLAPAATAPPAPGSTPVAAPATQPPPQNALPKADQPKATYDPDLPMPPSAE
ncbi:MAG TPA: hypothetical protein VGP07_08215 [Polyangia bacterium]